MELIFCMISIMFTNIETVDFPGGLVVKNLPASAEDMGSMSGSGRSHMPQDNQARVPYHWAHTPETSSCN